MTRDAFAFDREDFIDPPEVRRPKARRVAAGPGPAPECPKCGKDSCPGDCGARRLAFEPLESLDVFMSRVSALPAPRTLLGDLFPDDAITVLHGQPRAKKTLFYLDCLLAMATGTVGCIAKLRAEEPTPVAFVCEEDSERRVHQRLRWLLKGRGLEVPSTFMLSVRRGVSLDHRDWQDWLVGQMQENGVRHLGLDPLRGLTMNADQGPDKLAPITAFLRRIQNETPCKSIGLIHHDTKPIPNVKDDRARAQRASGGGIFSIADAPVHVEKVTGTRSLVMPNNFKFSDDPESFAFNVEHDTPVSWVRLVGENTTEAAAEEDAIAGKVLAWIERNPGQNTERIKEAIGGHRQTVSDVLTRLEEQGRLRMEEGKRKSKLWFTTGTSRV